MKELSAQELVPQDSGLDGNLVIENTNENISANAGNVYAGVTWSSNGFVDYIDDVVISTSYISPSSGSSSSNAPTMPSLSGPSTGTVGTFYAFTASSSDPEHDYILYKFDWNDGTSTDMAWYSYGAYIATATHSWASAGTFNVQVKAQDISGNWSSWSTASQIVISGQSGSQAIFEDGFESGNFSQWPLNNAASIVTSPVYSGSYAAQATGPASYWQKTLSNSYSDLFFAAYIRFPALPSAGTDTFFLTIQDAAYQYVVAGGISRDSGGSMNWLLRVNSNWYPVAATVQANQWYLMQIEYNTNGSAKLWVNGDLVNSASGSLPSNATILQGGNPYGATPAGFVTYGDNYIATATSSQQSTYYIIATAGTGGIISPSGQIAVNDGDTPTFTITPNTGYYILDVRVNGISQGPISNYTFQPVIANETITATFSGSPPALTLFATNAATAWTPQDVSPTDIDWMHQHGFTAVRICLTWSQLQPNDGNSVSSSALSQWDSTIQRTEYYGMYTLLCVYMSEGAPPPSWTQLSGSSWSALLDPSNGFKSAWGYMLGQLASHYSWAPHLMIELLNEPFLLVGASSTDCSNYVDWGNSVVSSIRSAEGTGTKHWIVFPFLVDVNNFPLSVEQAAIASGDGRIVWQCHFYSGGLDQHYDPDQNVGGTNGCPPGTTFRQYISWYMERAANAAHAMGCPILNTEFGKKIQAQALVQDSDAVAQEWINDVVTAIEDNGYWGWVFHCYKQYDGMDIRGASGETVFLGALSSHMG